jgi:hypothetical protein
VALLAFLLFLVQSLLLVNTVVERFLRIRLGHRILTGDARDLSDPSDLIRCQSYTHNGTSAAQHKTQGKRKADRWKIDCERRREEHKTLLNFPSPKSLNHYWLLIFYFNIVHLLSFVDQ